MENAHPRCWLVLSYFANIDGKVTSNFVDDRVPKLREMGIEPILISSPCGERKKDFHHFTVPSVAPSGLRFELRYLRRRNTFLKYALLPVYIAVLPLYLLEKLILNVDSEWSWFPLAFLRGLRICQKVRPEIIYTTGPPATAYVAGALLSAFTKTPWIAELNDPLIYGDFHHTKMELLMHALIERLVFDRASGVVFMSDGARDDAIARAGVDPSRTRTIHAGAAKPDLPPYSWSRGDFCRFAHFGSLGGSRNLDIFLRSLDRIFAAFPDLVKVVRLDLYGAMDGLSRNLISNFKHPGVVTDFGKVGRRDAQLAMQRSDVLLLIHNLDDFGSKTVPAKLYDYFHVNRPVLGMVYRSSSLRGILSRYGQFVAEADSVEETVAVVTRIIEKWQNGDLTGPNWTTSPFTLEAALESLVEMADGVLARGRGKVAGLT